jgi:nucleoid-associated protein YgaU
MADQLEQLKQKYQSVLNMAPKLGIQMQHVNMSGNKLYIQGIAPSEDAKNKIWDQIKLIDSGYSDLIADFSVSATAAPPQTQAAGAAAGGGQNERTYTIQAGDTLSGISQRFYGKASEYAKILDANRDKIKDADHIKAGQTIVIP